METNIILAAIGGLITGGAVVWAFMERKVARLNSALAGKDAEVSARAVMIDAQFKAMMAEMSNVTAETLRRREAELAERNGEQIERLLAPMKERLEAFRKAAEDSKKTNGELGTQIGEFFKGIKATSESFGSQAKSFIDALSGANKKQGTWGEQILRQLLENCGLKEGEGFFAQTGTNSGIPDVQVVDPSSKKILIIDSKMSWTKYEEAYKLPDGEAKTAALKEHVASVKRHIDELARANYPQTQKPPKAGCTYVPITAMFVPSDAALSAALEFEPGLIDYALKRDISIVSPLSLFGFLVLVSHAWSRWTVDKNSDKIYEEAKKLVGYIDRMFKNFEELGESLKKAEEKYEAAKSLLKLEPSGQCIKGPAMKILKLGARPEKEIKSQALSEEA